MKSGFDALKKSYSQLKSDVKAAHLDGMLPLAKGLREFFREQITPERAKEEIKKALGSREERFLRLARSKIYECPRSPYLRLLKLVGCEFSDLQVLVRRDGLDSALQQLASEGVYLTSAEFKGKKTVRRSGVTFRVSPTDFEKEKVSAGFITQSSGTMNRPLRIQTSLEWLSWRALAIKLFHCAHNLDDYSHALYDAILPGSAINHLLTNAKLGKATERWFARRIPVNNVLEGSYHYFTTYWIVLNAKRLSSGFPRPEFIDLSEICKIVKWIANRKRAGRKSYIITVASSAVRIAQTAREMGISLEGTKFNVAGEPFTETKEDVIRQSGAEVISRYSYGGGTPVGYGCANPTHRDEVHVNQHMLAIIHHPNPVYVQSPHIQPLLLTTLHSSAPRFLLNVDNGDYALFSERDCGCTLGKVGFKQHIHSIRSYEKFTTEGMSYSCDDLFELLEKVLPAEFGGGTGDYQLVEEEDDRAQTRLTLVVHPKVGPLNEETLLARLREGLSQGPKGNRFMTRLWQESGAFRIARKAPHTSGRGKILPLHVAR